jgi:type II secretory pathway pseudopilin PulG
MKAPSAPRGFLLLEVILSLSILGLASMMLLRAYTVSLDTIRKADTINTAAILAESLIEELDLRGYAEAGRLEGNFGEDFPEFYWRAEVDEERLRYSHVESGIKVDDLEPLRTIDVTIFYQRNEYDKPFVPLHFSYHPLLIENFSLQAKFENQLY